MGKVLYQNYFPPFNLAPTCDIYCPPSYVEADGVYGGLKSIMALVWRVREIKLYFVLGDNGDHEEVTTLTSAATKEEDLILGSTFNITTTWGNIIGEPFIQYYVQGGGEVARLGVHLENITGIYWGVPPDYVMGGEIIDFSIGQTGLTASMGFSYEGTLLYPYPTKVECTQFWSYGGTYNTSTGKPL